jgi:hypothetical protein
MSAQSHTMPFVDVELNKLHRQNSYYAFDRVQHFSRTIQNNPIGSPYDNKVKFSKKFNDGEYTQITGIAFYYDAEFTGGDIPDNQANDVTLSIYDLTNNIQVLGFQSYEGIEGISLRNMTTPYMANSYGNRITIIPDNLTFNERGWTMGDRIGQLKFERKMNYMLPPLANIQVELNSNDFVSADIHLLLKTRIYRMEFKL